MLLERLPLELSEDIISYLSKADLVNLIKCNSKLYGRYISHLYSDLQFYCPSGISGLYGIQDIPYRDSPTPEADNPDDQDDSTSESSGPISPPERPNVLKIGPFSEKALNSVRSFSIITRDEAVISGYEHARDPEDEFTKILYDLFLLPISRNGIAERFQWHRAEAKTPSFMPELLHNMSPTLVSLSLDIDGTADNLTAEDFSYIHFGSLQKIRLMIKPSLRNVQTAYVLLKAAPELIDVDLDFTSFLRPPIHSGKRDEYGEPIAELVDPNGPDHKRDPESFFLECSALSGLSKLQRLGICYIDCQDLLSSVKLENLKDVTLRYCRNWEAMTKYAAANKQLHLEHIHISAHATEILAIKAFLENGIAPGLQTMMVMIHMIDETNAVLTKLRKSQSREESIYFLPKDAVLKHSATLRNFAFYVAMGRDDGHWEPECLTRYTSALPYLLNIREDDMYEIEVDSFRNLRLDTVEVLYLIPNSWPHFVYYYCTDGGPSGHGVQWMVIDFLEAAFQHCTDRPKLQYVVFGLENHKLSPYEYKVEWIEGRTQDEEDRKDPEYCERDGYSYHNVVTGTWSYEVLSYEKNPEETNVELFHRSWMEKTRAQRLRRARDKVFPVKWNPHLREVDVAKEITHGGPKSKPFRLYSAQFQDDDWPARISLLGRGLPMY
ncbi:hypothetical protein TWF718_003481 [Orbilia javanica]|uniref:F-box domain-containing protein n=1 Tax=Orbilia javanica TaxID=47235 RepID=A0AAN8MEV3_9PEZI